MTEFRRKETLENAFSLIVSEILKAKLNVSMPALVTAYDGKNRVTVQPVVNRKYVGQDSKPLPPIEDVPIKFFGSGGYWLTVDIEVGTGVLLVCSQRSIDAWKNSSDGAVGDASTPRRFSMSDAIALPGLETFEQAVTVSPGIELRNRAGDVKVSVNGTAITLDNGTSTIILDGADVTIDNGSGTITIDSAGQVDINGHLTVDA